ncbi:MAG: hypothetical protein IIY93_02300 [Clostridia bacterium]|jgi:hypothetical protein|nr:hypothetical protein [Clostridia bacterium]MBQ1555806.1 hypothetical protein [Clostridia bacterium]MBQ4396988.1 hypothetical protein [Clostridia bacterium]
MQDIKFTLAVMILAVCIPYLIYSAIEKLFGFSLPRFVKENSNELSILAAASCVMGFVLVIF